MRIDITMDPIGQDKKGKDVFLKDIWPTTAEIADDPEEGRHLGHVRQALCRRLQGRQALAGHPGRRRPDLRLGRCSSTYVANPPYFEGLSMEPTPVTDIIEGRVLAIFGDSITTDHISPAGSIKKTSPAGQPT
jgi:aconitate hydratase